MQDTRTDNTLLDIITSLRKHILGVVCVFTAVVSVAAVFIFTRTPIYEAGSNILVKYGREYIFKVIEPYSKGVDAAPRYNFNISEVINTELEIFRSHELAAEVIKKLGIDTIFPDLQEVGQDETIRLATAIDRFRKMLEVFHIKGSSVIGVAFQHPDPEVAVQVVAHLTELFKKRHLEIYKNPQLPFLEEQVGIYTKKLQKAEETKKEFKLANQIFALREQRDYILQQFVAVKLLLIKDKSAMDELAEKKASFAKQLESVPEFVVQADESRVEGVRESSEAKLLQLQLHEHELLEKYPEQNRLVVAVRRDIEMVKDFLASHTTSSNLIRKGKNPLYLDLERGLSGVDASYAGLQKKIESLDKQSDKLKDELQRFSEQEIGIKRVNDEVVAAQYNLRQFKQKLVELQVRDAMDNQQMVNIVVIEKPRKPMKPVKPRKKIGLIIGIILGAASSLFYALFAEYAMARKI